MKALVYTAPHRLELQNVEYPMPMADEVVVAVEAVGICGSDMHAWHGRDERRPPPLILGHEAAGRINVGSRRGERVAINPLVTCGVCPACLAGNTNICPSRQIISMTPRPGAFAQFVRIPERNIVTVPPGFPLEKAALTEPVAVSYHAVSLAEKLSRRPFPNAECLVIGGGAIGLAAALCLKMFGARNIAILESNSIRREMLSRVENFTVLSDKIDQPFADVVIDAVGSDDSRSTSSIAVRPGGTIVHVGLQGGTAGLNIRYLTLQEVNFVGAYTYTMAEFHETLQALSSGRLGALDWVEERPLEEGPQAFNDLHENKAASAKILLRI